MDSYARYYVAWSSPIFFKNILKDVWWDYLRNSCKNCYLLISVWFLFIFLVYVWYLLGIILVSFASLSGEMRFLFFLLVVLRNMFDSSVGNIEHYCDSIQISSKTLLYLCKLLLSSIRHFEPSSPR